MESSGDEILGDGKAHYIVEDDDSSDERPVGVLREQDRFLPIANVARLMKKSIPKTGKIAKDARECVQECVSEFVSFITSEASDRCHLEKRKTINGEDILFAMQALGFDNYVDPLKLYLQKYRDLNKGEKGLPIGGDESFSNISSGSTITVKTESGSHSYTIVATSDDINSCDILQRAAVAAGNTSNESDLLTNVSNPSNVCITPATAPPISASVIGVAVKPPGQVSSLTSSSKAGGQASNTSSKAQPSVGAIKSKPSSSQRNQLRFN